MSAFGIGKRTTTFANAAGYGTGWTLNDAGQPVMDGDGYVEFTATAVLQPLLGSRRRQEDAGVQEEDRIKGHVYRGPSGYPDIRAAQSPGRVLPTLVRFRGRWYEVQKVGDWTDGLLPHLSFEAELLGLERPPSAVDVDPGDDPEEPPAPDTVEW